MRSSKQTKNRGWTINNDADFEKLKKLMCGANQKHSAKALRHVQLEDELDDIATFVERTGSSKPRKVARSGQWLTVALLSL